MRCIGESSGNQMLSRRPKSYRHGYLERRAAADYFQERTCVLEESFLSFPSIYPSVTMHATIIAHSAKSPTLHNVIALYPMARVVWSNRHPEPDRSNATDRHAARWRSASRTPSAVLPPCPAIYYQRRALCHGAEPLVHVFLTYRVHGGVLVILTSAAL